MKQLFILLLIVCSFPDAYCQLKGLDNINIWVNENENVHLIFKSEIKYFDTENPGIGCDRPGQTNNIVRMRAKNKEMAPANLAIATADGKFYSFLIQYRSEIPQTTYFIGDTLFIQPETIYIDCNNPVHLIFNKPLVYFDRGISKIDIYRDDNIKNILKVSAKNKFDKTNISAFTGDNFYTYNLVFTDSLQSNNYTYYVGSDDTNQAILNNTELTDQEKENIVKSIKRIGRKINHLGVYNRKMNLKFTVHNIFVRDNKLIFKFEIQNKSNIKYDARNMLFEIVDFRISRRTTEQENTRIPLFIDSSETDFNVPGKSKATFIVCFDKFTIPDDKVFHIYIDEDGGGRAIDYNLRNQDLINAQTI